jgi:hypothetical protein
MHGSVSLGELGSIDVRDARRLSPRGWLGTGLFLDMPASATPRVRQVVDLGV